MKIRFTVLACLVLSTSAFGLSLPQANDSGSISDDDLLMGKRYRSLYTGAYLSRDPAGMVDGPNLYAHVGQNPWTRFDPLGLNDVTILAAKNSGDTAEILERGHWQREQQKREGTDDPLKLLHVSDRADARNQLLEYQREVGKIGDLTFATHADQRGVVVGTVDNGVTPKNLMRIGDQEGFYEGLKFKEKSTITYTGCLVCVESTAFIERTASLTLMKTVGYDGYGGIVYRGAESMYSNDGRKHTRYPSNADIEAAAQKQVQTQNSDAGSADQEVDESLDDDASESDEL